MDGCGGDRNLLNIVPTEVLVYIVSLIATRDRTKLQFVSRKLRSVSETPLLWREFVWPYYHTGDEGCVNNTLKVYGEHVQRLVFPNHVPPPNLMNILEYCSNVIEFSLPTTELQCKDVENILLHMQHLQRLDVRWMEKEIKQLLELVGMNLTELTIRADHEISNSVSEWINYWMSNNFVPQKLNVVTSLYRYCINELMRVWFSLNPKSPAGYSGLVKLYSQLQNFSPVFPEFQLDFGRNVTLPFVRASRFGLPYVKEDLLLLTDGIHHSDVVHKASLNSDYSYLVVENQLKSTSNQLTSNLLTSNLKFVTEFSVSFSESFLSEHLQQLAVVCPNLHQLNLQDSKRCLKDLRGLRAIASYCHNLQGLNLMGIPVTEVEDQTQLWEILTGMKLTHLAVHLCVLSPTRKDKQKLIMLFQTYTKLRELMCTTKYCVMCNNFDRRLLMLSHFPSLTKCIVDICFHYSTTTKQDVLYLQDLLTSCKKLKCVNYSQDNWSEHLFLPIHNNNLEQFHICARHINLPTCFMSTISAHGGLVHVMLRVKSVTSEGVTALVRNSPKLMTLYGLLYDDIYGDNDNKLNLTEFEAGLRQEHSSRPLFVMGRCLLAQHYRLETKYILHVYEEVGMNADFFTIW